MADGRSPAMHDGQTWGSNKQALEGPRWLIFR